MREGKSTRPRTRTRGTTASAVSVVVTTPSGLSLWIFRRMIRLRVLTLRDSGRLKVLRYAVGLPVTANCLSSHLIEVFFQRFVGGC